MGEVFTGTVGVGDEMATVQLVDPAVVCTLDARGMRLGNQVAVRLVDVRLVERQVVFQQA